MVDYNPAQIHPFSQSSDPKRFSKTLIHGREYKQDSDRRMIMNAAEKIHNRNDFYSNYNCISDTSSTTLTHTK